MFVFYNILISFLFLLFLPFSLLHVFGKAEFVVRDYLERLGVYPKCFEDYLERVKKEKKDLVWIHAASLGEIKMATAILNGLQERQTDFNYVVSTNSRAGRQMAEQLFGPEKTILIPVDLPWIIKHLVEKIRPKLSIFVEFEAHPNLIHFLSKTGSKLVLLNGSMDNKILKDYYAYFPGLLALTLRKFDFLGMKTAKEAEKIKNMGVEPDKIEVTGNIKMDYSFKIIVEDKIKRLKQKLKIPANAEVIIVGSTHSGEEELIFKIYRELKREVETLVLLLAPRHIERTKRIKRLGEKYGLKLVERSKIDSLAGWLTGDEILILDTMGELAELYSIATIVFVGGSLVDKGGHNLFEPVVYGKPVLFGPYIQDFAELAQLLMAKRIGIMVKDEEELKTQIISLLKDKTEQKAIYERARKLLKEDKGLMEGYINLVEQLLKQKIKKGGFSSVKSKKILFLSYCEHQRKFFSFLRDHMEKKKAILLNSSLCFLRGIFQKKDKTLPREDVERLAKYSYLKFKSSRDNFAEDFINRLYWKFLLYKTKVLYCYCKHYIKNKVIDLVIVWNGCHAEAASCAKAARDLGVKVLFMEDGYFPGTIVMDEKGVNAASYLTGKEAGFYQKVETDPEKMAQLKEIKLVPRALRTEFRGKEDFTYPPRYFFLPFQVKTDTQILLYSPQIRDMYELADRVYSALERFNRKYNRNYWLVIKEHPSDYGRVNYDDLKKRYAGKQVAFTTTLPSSDLIESSEAVITINSNVGLEALFKGKPVITLGEAFFNVEGLVYHCTDLSKLEDEMEKAISNGINQELVNKFLYYLRYEYLVDCDKEHPTSDNIKPVLKRIEEATANRTGE